jgi:hypothetical protein
MSSSDNEASIAYSESLGTNEVRVESLSGASEQTQRKCGWRGLWNYRTNSSDSRGIVADPFAANHVKFVVGNSGASRAAARHNNKPLNSYEA